MGAIMYKEFLLFGFFYFFILVFLILLAFDPYQAGLQAGQSQCYPYSVSNNAAIAQGGKQ
jgi:hypothetical protein